MPVAQSTGVTTSRNSPKIRENWNHGLSDCCSPLGICCMATWCPCVVFGKMTTRTKNDPDPSCWNTMCGLYGVLMCIGGVPCLLQWINRGNTRERYNIEGSRCGDLCISCCCGSCALVQEEKESLARINGKGLRTANRYSSPEGMSYS